MYIYSINSIYSVNVTHRWTTLSSWTSFASDSLKMKKNTFINFMM